MSATRAALDADDTDVLLHRCTDATQELRAASGTAPALPNTMGQADSLHHAHRAPYRRASRHRCYGREDESPDALARLISTAEGAALHRCLGELEEDRRRLVVMAFVDGLSHSELAEHMSVPLGTVKSWIRRSLLLLRGCLAS